MKHSMLTPRLINKILLSFLLLIVLIGVSYVFITFYFTNKYFEETTQQLNADVADHLITEKFQDASPFLEDGSVNKALFGDIMHDMMAVNQGIEVYLLDQQGQVLYSVVLDHSDTVKAAAQVDLQPIRKFVAQQGKGYVVGDDPRNPEQKKIFSAAPFSIDGQQGYIYIILASQQFEAVTSSLFGSYFQKLGLTVFTATILFSGLLCVLVLWYLTKNLRQIVETVKCFKEGDFTARIPHAKEKDLSILAETFNEMADTLAANIEELKSVESLRRELIANVSHDLRTPLAIMQGYVETLQIKKQTISVDDRDKYLDIVQNSIEKLNHLINNLFEYSKLEARQIEPQKEPFPISDLAHDVYEKYQQMAENKQINIRLVIEDNLPMVYADISLVERVIQNLMDNALKFSPEQGEVCIELYSDERQVYVAIRDNGPGIPIHEQPHIFESFRKASVTKQPNPGAGLGLAIAKKIVEIHQGTLSVRSLPNQGTIFTFNLNAIALHS